MSVIYLVFPLATLIVLAAVVAFVWSARRGQFDDLDTPPVRMLHDEQPTTNPTGSSPSPRPGARRPLP
jgi:cbb3-type cytochrome oxidase maturation protein